MTNPIELIVDGLVIRARCIVEEERDKSQNTIFRVWEIEIVPSNGFSLNEMYVAPSDERDIIIIVADKLIKSGSVKTQAPPSPNMKGREMEVQVGTIRELLEVNDGELDALLRAVEHHREQLGIPVDNVRAPGGPDDCPVKIAQGAIRDIKKHILEQSGVMRQIGHHLDEIASCLEEL